ncbi:uncharacterized protein LOC142982602 isoform X2 [Anticarsia gemmatalis]|uniref:uncharacterized protein LOC142982602 isoform X2 n=1 Tax=Anticarsia gemmatalis TaxID=129554 RepID=UPI003F76609F
MERNEEISRLPPRGDNSELEKFKRRLIRAVSRMLLHEKRNEDEVWAGLKKETGCDCKELWDRMCALTMKKMDRLLKAEDRVEYLPKAARMSITDWLMFDMYLVHSDFDVIGMRETTKEDPKVLVDLFELVEKFNIEFLAGSSLAHVWSNLTLEYNKDIRQVTPMLLQRRWYQLKCITRSRFYKYWSVYKGVSKRLHLSEPYKPTPLQTRIASNYKPLVVKPFMMWEELITNQLVILPEEFERRSFDKQGALNEAAPDVMCIEPNVETINLDPESDTELEYRKPDNIEHLNPPTVQIKQEPKDPNEVDETVPSESRQEKISNFAEAVMEAMNVELDEMELVEQQFEGEDSQHDESDVLEVETGDGEKETADVNDEVISTEKDNKQASDDDVLVIDDEVNSTNQDIVLPQITSIFGGVDVSNESLSKIGMLAAEITKNSTPVINKVPENSTTIDNTEKSKDIDDSVEIIENDDKPIELSDSIEDTVHTSDGLSSGVDLKPDVSAIEVKQENEFDDEGWMMLDDGIVYHDEEFPMPVEAVKTEVLDEGEDVAEVAEVAESDIEAVIDPKITMIPVVYATKLDDMNILPVNLLQHVDNKAMIDLITFRNKPIIPKTKTEPKAKPSEETPPVKRVKLSSNLLKKPRSCSYNPIQLCKNPDFNTRLKRLNVGFFSSSRNRLLLKACQPLTIDISKAFESRLVDGTMYLQPSNDEDVDVEEVRDIESACNASVVPTAMAVQSLINNTQGDITNVAYPPEQRPVEVPAERNKVINLPDISEIRRINQGLLTAQVTPLQLDNEPDTCINVDSIPPRRSVGRRGGRTAGPASRTMYSYTTNLTPAVNITKEYNFVNPESLAVASKKRKVKPCPWKAKPTKAEIPWIDGNNSIYSPDTLLALDTLNKMLFVLNDGLEIDLASRKKFQKARKYNSGNVGRPSKSAKDALKDKNSSSVPPESDDVEVVSVTKTKRKRGRPKSKSTKVTYCCWARERICQMIFSKVTISKHSCPFPVCMCCCRGALALYFRKRREEAAASGAQPHGREASTLEKNKEAIEVISSVAQILPTATARDTINANFDLLLKDNKNADKDVSNADVVCSGDAAAEVTVETTTDSCEDSTPASDAVPDSTGTILSDQDMDTCTNTGEEVVPDTSAGAGTVPLVPATFIKTSRAQYVPPINVTVTHAKPYRKNKWVSESPASKMFRKCKDEKTGPTRVVIDPSDPEQTRTIFETTPQFRLIKKVAPFQNITKIVEPPKSDPAKSSRKVIYLNSKQLAELPTHNPIYLGKNTILLTTARFPANFKAFEAYQQNINQTLALPKGIQLILLPSGRVTYSRDPRVEVSSEFMSLLPQLISAIQEQINKGIDSAAHVPPDNACETIDVSDDDAVDDKSEQTDINATTSVVDAAVTNDQVESEQETDDIYTSKDGNEKQLQEVVKIDGDDNEPVEEPLEIPQPEDQSEEVVAACATEPVNTSVDESVPENIESTMDTETPEKSQDDNTVPSESTPTEGAKTKNILSDLMALSGIGPIDMTPEEVTPTPQQEIALPVTNATLDLPRVTPSVLPAPQEIVPVTTQHSTAHVTVPKPPLQLKLMKVSPLSQRPLVVPQATPQINHRPKLVKLTTSAGPRVFTPITSLSELKFACTQEGLFYKLNLETGLLLSINVCMKNIADEVEQRAQVIKGQFYTGRLPRRIAPKPLMFKTRSIVKSIVDPKPVIDLTEDEVNEQTESNVEELVDLPDSPPENNDEGCSNVGEHLVPVTNMPSDTGESTVAAQTSEPAKPIKLIKSRVSKPKILEQRLMAIQKRISEAMLKQDRLRRRLKRKQDLAALRNDSDMEELEPAASVPLKRTSSWDNSSDDEPLAKKVSKKKRAVKSDEVVNITAKRGKGGADVASEDVDVENVSTIDEDMAVERLGEARLGELIEVVSLPLADTEQKDEDDCILGV